MGQCFPADVDIRQVKLVPKLRSKISSKAAAKSTGNESTPIIAVKKSAQIVRGILVNDIPLVRRLMIVVMKLKPAASDDSPRI